MTSDLDFISHLARQAGKLLLEHYQRAGLKTTTKSDHSIVTEADLASDRLISAAIRETYTDDLVLSEEMQTTYQPGGRQESDQPVWIIDPLDGTTNFALGLHVWGVLIARLAKGWPEIAALYFPLLDELYTAQRGHGARLNQEPIHAKPLEPDQPAAFFSCCSRTFRRYQVNLPYKTRILGSSAYSLCNVARGAAVLSFEARPKIWDIAGPWLLVQEAEGVIETYDGSTPFPIVPGLDYSTRDFPTLAAATPELIEQARRQIQPKAKS